MLRLSNQAQKTYVCPNKAFTLAKGLFILSFLAFASACGSHSQPNSMNGSVPGSTAALNISAALPGATVGTGYNAAVTVTGGTAPYTFSVSSGALPSGVQLSESTGTI